VLREKEKKAICVLWLGRRPITMSFGFSIGDFITVIQLANKIRKVVVEAPAQFNF
jgi:hypothetical protein